MTEKSLTFTDAPAERIQKNVCDVRRRICDQTSRNGIGQDVSLVAVTKNQPEEVFAALSACGVTHFAENRVSALTERAALMNGTRHLIGHLQTNKVRRAIEAADLIHSVDSLHLAREISRCAAAIGKTQQILIQVNVAREERKFGIPEEELDPLLRAIAALPSLQVRGLMAIMPIETDDSYYRRMYELFCQYRSSPLDGVTMDILSMGMSNDFETAVRYGANMVRVGRRLFEE